MAVIDMEKSYPGRTAKDKTRVLKSIQSMGNLEISVSGKGGPWYRRGYFRV